MTEKDFAEQAPMREKYWKECSQEEKIERMRKEVKRINMRLDRALIGLEKLMRHAHLRNELVFFDLRYDVNLDTRSKINDDETYF